MHLFEQIDRTVKPTRYTGSRLRRIDFGYNDHPLTTSSVFAIFLVAVSGTQWFITLLVNIQNEFLCFYHKRSELSVTIGLGGSDLFRDLYI